MATTFNITPEPKQTPWGAILNAEQYAPGIWRVWTVLCDHTGCYMLSPERVAAMPKVFKFAPMAEQGCFDQENHWAAVLAAFPEEFSENEVHGAYDAIKVLAVGAANPRPWRALLAHLSTLTLSIPLYRPWQVMHLHEIPYSPADGA